MRRGKTIVMGIGLAVCALLTTAPQALAADVVAEWDSVKPPPKPELKNVQLQRGTTALLILDIQTPGCTMERRPRCVATLGNIQTLLDSARGLGVPVIYTFSRNDPQDVADPALKPQPGEWIGRNGPDKFVGSDLDARLKAKGIKTVVVTGSSAQGAVLGTSTGAALRGYKVILPVDAMSAEDPYEEQYTAWQLSKAGPAAVRAAVTLTRTTMIRF
jgi:nicotinamidase-related amidase